MPEVPNLTPKEIIERKIFLKRQLIELEEQEIKILENQLTDEGKDEHS
jgi:hypothetical protein